jgi:hypothetical protein
LIAVSANLRSPDRGRISMSPASTTGS